MDTRNSEVQSFLVKVHRLEVLHNVFSVWMIVYPLYLLLFHYIYCYVGRLKLLNHFNHKSQMPLSVSRDSSKLKSSFSKEADVNK